MNRIYYCSVCDKTIKPNKKIIILNLLLIINMKNLFE